MFTIKNVLEKLPHPPVPEHEVYACHSFKVKPSAVVSFGGGAGIGDAINGVAMPVKKENELRIYMYEENGDFIQNILVENRAYIINCNGKTVDVITP